MKALEVYLANPNNSFYSTVGDSIPVYKCEAISIVGKELVTAILRDEFDGWERAAKQACSLEGIRYAFSEWKKRAAKGAE